MYIDDLNQNIYLGLSQHRGGPNSLPFIKTEMNVSRTNPLDAFSFQTIGAHPFHWFRSRDLFWGNHGQHYQSQSVSCKFLSTSAKTGYTENSHPIRPLACKKESNPLKDAHQICNRTG